MPSSMPSAMPKLFDVTIAETKLRPCRYSSRERQVHVADRLIDLLGVLEADRRGIHSRVLESEPHCFHTIVMIALELTAAAELHADHTQAFLLQLLDVLDHFAHVVWVVGVLIGRAIHTCAV